MATRSRQIRFAVPRTPAVVTALAVAACVLLAGATPADAKHRRSHHSRSIAKHRPVITKLKTTSVEIGANLVIFGRHFTRGRNKDTIVFQRAGGRRYTVRATGNSSKQITVVVPDVSAELVNGQPTRFRLRAINKYGISKKATPDSRSPLISPSQGNTGSSDNPDCDGDHVPNSTDTDDDNDLLPDTTERAIGTDTCKPDTDGDGVSDYYEYRVALQLGGDPTLPYPIKWPGPDPLHPDSGVDHDGDGLTMLDEYQLWQYTGRMDRFYSDASQDSDGNGTTDENEDEDHDLLSNYVEKTVFATGDWRGALSMLNPDSDGDGLCDGLDDQDHDGAPTPVSQADCTTPVPNNVVPGDPDAGMIDGDDNAYSNIGEVLAGTDPYNPCDPDPNNQYCPLH